MSFAIYFVVSTVLTLWAVYAARNMARHSERALWFGALERVQGRAEGLATAPRDGASWALAAACEDATGQQMPHLQDLRMRAFAHRDAPIEKPPPPPSLESIVASACEHNRRLGR